MGYLVRFPFSRRRVMLLVVVFALLAFSTVFGCENPTVQTRYYTSTDSLLSSKTVFIVEGRATCENDELSELYAVLGDKIVPVSRNLETDEFQVTFSDDHMKLPKGYYSIRFYDDVGYLHLRKAQSQGRPLDSVKPVFTVDVYHPGIWLSPLIHSETVALLAASLIGFGAVITKNKFF
ncbi:Translocon-associated protein subunit delta [Echinococcus granulosus]|nr:Translocon-associated protein subunit delta [Echinococcus granulosus]